MIHITVNDQLYGIEFRYGLDTSEIIQNVELSMVDSDGNIWTRKARQPVLVQNRTTTCLVYEIEDETSRENPLVCEATSSCDSRDQFVKEIGRKNAIVKAFLRLYDSVQYAPEWVDNRIDEAIHQFDTYRQSQREEAWELLDIERAKYLLDTVEEKGLPV